MDSITNRIFIDAQEHRTAIFGLREVNAQIQNTVNGSVGPRKLEEQQWISFWSLSQAIAFQWLQRDHPHPWWCPILACVVACCRSILLRARRKCSSPNHAQLRERSVHECSTSWMVPKILKNFKTTKSNVHSWVGIAPNWHQSSWAAGKSL